ncbi:hypothetical protein GCM10009819_32090 [Agromyces tropicus]|uniref:HTH tetR-type domain-containing protein n=1 Tax=Agromyces tropicus TaxID=555371 RepID=A0ABN2UT83_9MICO
MRQWMPISTSPKGRLALAAVRAFGARPFAEVPVVELAADAGVTTGALYHHFGSKLGLYAFVRADVERRLLDRVEGALAGSAEVDDLIRALAVGFDFVVRDDVIHLLDAPPPVESGPDALAEVIAEQFVPRSDALGAMLAAAWRAAVREVGAGADAEQMRSALLSLSVRT